ncbi:sugar O-acetyltransferase [Roseospira visakhapatnamensis]|uniref:Nodulation protein L n=1 Tax=Roseospira visakhapatnamensis TaxID=390880 RepID=A0A7W6WAQ0_9PROT|nr:sugar O-acetyltransferase [Roseospira visakhapatnamensis]MBB4266736.1 maltose O-acetyltransferase [Roseospira visakhapatnamensis]
MSSQKENMLAGDLYDPGDPDLCEERSRAQRLMRAYNQTIVDDGPVRTPLLKAMLGGIGAHSAIRAPIYIDYGYNIFVGDHVFMNYGCVVLDVCRITIGSGTQIGPGVQIYAADHPRDPKDRAAGLEMGKPVTIGANVWIGGHAVLLPGVTIGDDAIIGAGSIVTRDVPAGVTVAGNPAKPTGVGAPRAAG